MADAYYVNEDSDKVLVLKLSPYEYSALEMALAKLGGNRSKTPNKFIYSVWKALAEAMEGGHTMEESDKFTTLESGLWWKDNSIEEFKKYVNEKENNV